MLVIWLRKMTIVLETNVMLGCHLGECTSLNVRTAMKKERKTCVELRSVLDLDQLDHIMLLIV